MHSDCLVRLRMSHERSKHPKSNDNSSARCPSCRVHTFDVGQEPTDLSISKVTTLVKSSEHAIAAWKKQVNELRDELKCRDVKINELLQANRIVNKRPRPPSPTSYSPTSYSPTSPSYTPTSPSYSRTS